MDSACGYPEICLFQEQSNAAIQTTTRPSSDSPTRRRWAKLHRHRVPHRSLRGNRGLPEKGRWTAELFGSRFPRERFGKKERIQRYQQIFENLITFFQKNIWSFDMSALMRIFSISERSPLQHEKLHSFRTRNIALQRIFEGLSETPKHTPLPPTAFCPF